MNRFNVSVVVGPPVPGDPAVLNWSDQPNLDRSRVWGTAVPVPAGADGSHQIMLLGGNQADSRSGGEGASVNKRLFSPERVLGYLWPTQGRTLPPVFKVRHETEIA